MSVVSEKFVLENLGDLIRYEIVDLKIGLFEDGWVEVEEDSLGEELTPSECMIVSHCWRTQQHSPATLT